MIFNKTNKTCIVKKHRFCDSVASKALGLMFSRKITDSGLVFRFSRESKQALHMFFVFYPIDVLFLDREKRIVEIKRHFRPFTVYLPKKKSVFIIELPDGKAKDCCVRDNIIFK
ncbi:MAG: DUF192 domain-containing protein [Candidatus Woesearchaeota archaeon]|nr:DUF192 domain-containing protein [Candidatus Woesearchaeota archaeon]